MLDQPPFLEVGDGEVQQVDVVVEEEQWIPGQEQQGSGALRQEGGASWWIWRHR